MFDGIRDTLWLFTAAVFRINESQPEYRGTCTFVRAAGKDGILTAAHLWDSLRGDSFGLALGDNLRILEINKAVVKPFIIKGKRFDRDGPDLAFVEIPQLDVQRIQQRKAFFNLDRRKKGKLAISPTYQSGLWSVLGAVEEQSEFNPTEACLGLRVYACGFPNAETRGGHDYLELPYDRRSSPQLPTSFGGISGSGLWQVLIAKSRRTQQVNLSHAELEGVAFFQEPDANSSSRGVIRCHARQSLYSALLSVIGTAI